MAAHVLFFTPRGVGPTVHAPGVGQVRVREAVTVPGTTTAVAQEGEVVMVFNADATNSLVALGTTPDAAATEQTAGTTAGYPAAPGLFSGPFVPNEGDKVNVKALV